MRGAIPSLPQYASMAWCSVKKHRDNFTFSTVGLRRSSPITELAGNYKLVTIITEHSYINLLKYLLAHVHIELNLPEIA
jgi:hypothetical protein